MRNLLFQTICNLNYALLILICWLPLDGQLSGQSGNTELSEKTKSQIKWAANIYEHGVRQDADSLFISAEVHRILSNPELKAFLYPETYSWESTIYLLEKMELKKAFWFLINLYPQNKEMVMKTILRYDKILKMDKALISSLYTYAMLDPRVCDFANGKPTVKRPDLLEESLGNVKEMVDYVTYYRTLGSNK